MKTKILLLLLVSLLSQIYSETIREIYYTPQNEDYAKYIKHVLHYDESDNLIMVESYLTNEFASEKGFNKQIAEYRNGIEYSFEMLQTEENTKNTGLIRRKEYVDENDVIIKTVLSYYDGNEYVFDKENVHILENFHVWKLQHFIEIFNENNPEEKVYIVETPIFKGITNVENVGDLSMMTDEDILLIKRWQATHSFNDIAKLYSIKIKVKEDGIENWIGIQNSVYDFFRKFENALIYYYYIGGYGKSPLFLMVDFIE